jgi:hypothetical protein
MTSAGRILLAACLLVLSPALVAAGNVIEVSADPATVRLHGHLVVQPSGARPEAGCASPPMFSRGPTGAGRPPAGRSSCHGSITPTSLSLLMSAVPRL